MRKKSKLVYGVGVNDADYNVQKFEAVVYTPEDKQIKKLVWICPFYRRWRDMLQRCYSDKFLLKNPTYKGCSVVTEWHRFSVFKTWMETQDWEGKELDKDILFPGNKTYGPDTCVFVSQEVNKFLNENKSARGAWPVGVCLHQPSKKFIAKSTDFNTKKTRTLGLYLTPDEAHKAWLAFKLKQAYILAAEQTDPRVAKALIDRYENYGKVD